MRASAIIIAGRYSYVSLGGLGRLIIDGRAQNDYYQMAAGAILVGMLALVVDLLIAVASRIAVSPGLTHRIPRRQPPAHGSGSTPQKESPA